MRTVPGQRERVLAVVRALKMAGIRVRNWKSFVQTPSQAESQESLQTFGFGRELQSLPQHHLADLDGGVPLFLVETCSYLSQHLHTEGLFRKTGSLSRIRTLRVELEQGERVFCPPLDASLQPCDVASLLKQFLRELPQPLIPVDLQGPLCQTQTLDSERDPQGARDRATLLLTALLPPAHTRTLRYFCTFLSQVAHRCDENRMEVGNLALVMAPNLLQCPGQPCRLTVHTEKQLDQQTAVVKALILHADRIGVLPSFVLDSLGSVDCNESTPPADGAVFSKRAGLSVYRSLRRQRRRSVGEIFVDAFSKLKPGRTPTGPPVTLEAPPEGQLLSRSPNPQSPSTVKRKASEETVPEVEGSAKKRRSLHDLRVDSQSVSSHSADESTGSQSPQAVKSSNDLHPNVSKRRSQIRGHRKSYRPPKHEDGAHCRRRSLRFFTMSGSSSGSPVLGMPAGADPEPCLSACRKLHDDKPSDGETSLRIPFILIDGPGTVLIGSEVDDDPDLLNCSFVENPEDALLPESPETLRDLQSPDRQVPGDGDGGGDDDDDDDHWVMLEDGESEVVVEYQPTQTSVPPEPRPEAVSEIPRTGDTVQKLEQGAQPALEPKQTKRSSKKGPRPRRSISMPEVSLEPCSDETEEALTRVSVKQPAVDGGIWSASVNLPISDGLRSTGGKKAGGKEKDGRESTLRRKCGSVLDRKKDKLTDSDPGVKRTQQRSSVAERLRSFSALATLLRTPRAAVPQLGHQKATARLRRQGARRFSRSFSHEGVPELVPGEGSPGPHEDQQAFVELSDEAPDPQCVPEYLPGLGALQNTPSQTSSVEDLTWAGSPHRAEESDNLQAVEAEPEGVVKAADREPECDLRALLEQQCRVADRQDCSLFPQSPGEAQRDAHHGLSNGSLLSHQQRAPPSSPVDLQGFRACTGSPPYSTFAERCIAPDSTPPFEASPCKDLVCLSFDGLISIGGGMNEKCSLSLDLSPPAFQFRHQGSRRRYRDSPRWPSHEVRMTTWKPLPL